MPKAWVWPLAPLCFPENKASVLMGPSVEKHVNINSSKKERENLLVPG